MALTEKPYNDEFDEYVELLNEYDSKYLEKLRKIVKKLGYNSVYSDDIWQACLWLELGYEERIKLSKKLRKITIGINKVRIKKLEALLEDDCTLISDCGLKPKKFIKEKKRLENNLEFLQMKTKAGHLKELVDILSIDVMQFHWDNVRQKEQIEFIYNLMKEFDFEWGIGYQVVEKISKNCLMKFDGKYEAEIYLKEIDNSEKYYIEETGLKVDDIPTARDRIRVQIQQAATNKLKPIIKEFDSIKSEV